MEKAIKEKIKKLEQLGIRVSEEQRYALYACENETQLDNCARRIIAMAK